MPAAKKNIRHDQEDDRPQPILIYFSEIQKVNSVLSFPFTGNATDIPYFTPQTLFPMKWENYFHYKGSLTTPSCDETVNWFVDQEPLKISSSQVSVSSLICFLICFLLDTWSCKCIVAVVVLLIRKQLNLSEICRYWECIFKPSKSVHGFSTSQP